MLDMVVHTFNYRRQKQTDLWVLGLNCENVSKKLKIKTKENFLKKMRNVEYPHTRMMYENDNLYVWFVPLCATTLSDI